MKTKIFKLSLITVILSMNLYAGDGILDDLLGGSDCTTIVSNDIPNFYLAIGDCLKGECNINLRYSQGVKKKCDSTSFSFITDSRPITLLKKNILAYTDTLFDVSSDTLQINKTGEGMIHVEWKDFKVHFTVKIEERKKINSSFYPYFVETKVIGIIKN